jgi:periplasmic protein TonB
VRKALIVSFVLHILILFSLWGMGWVKGSTIFVPSVYQVQLIAMPQVQAAPAVEVVQKVEADEAIPPPPEQKKVLKPKLKKEEPKKASSQTSSSALPNGGGTSDQPLSGMRSDEAFEYPYYLRIMVDKISRSWTNPYSGGGESVLATIYFRVQRDGTIVEPRVEKSSGIASFDRAALRAVINSNPLPSLPPDFLETQLTVHLDFEYRSQ